LWQVVSPFLLLSPLPRVAMVVVVRVLSKKHSRVLYLFQCAADCGSIG
jgi:hypothetical protein